MSEVISSNNRTNGRLLLAFTKLMSRNISQLVSDVFLLIILQEFAS